MNFKIGDIVIKRSGGNRMTISDIVENYCKCIWFVDSLEEGIFNSDDIVTVRNYRIIEERNEKINRLLELENNI